jgi:hypothetical protein
LDTTIELPNRKSWLLVVVFSILALQIVGATVLLLLHWSEFATDKNIFALALYAVLFYWLLRGLAWQYKGQREIIIAGSTLTLKAWSPMKSRTVTFDLQGINGFQVTDDSEKEGPLAMLQLVGIADRFSLSMTYGKKKMTLLRGNDISALIRAKEQLESR